MKIWIHINGVQEGPYDYSELPLDRMTAETPVWYQGMGYWTPAGKATLTAGLFNGTPSTDGATQAAPAAEEPDIEAEIVEVEPVRAGQGYGQRQYAQGAPWHQQVQQAEMEPCPPTYILWSVLLTVLCCNPIGIVAIALGASVSSKYRNFDIKGAKRTSETTAWWLIITIVTSLIILPFSLLCAF